MVPFILLEKILLEITGETTESALRLKSAFFDDAWRAWLWFGELDIQFV